ncbi:MAG: GNAT family N-acetyltransferase [Anaerolineae bacterium]|nr:GNAT family N-acetyltransferase [Anaerolineae bacterium]
MSVVLSPVEMTHRLNTQRRVMDWLHWWRLEEWQRSPFLQVLEDGKGAALAVPIGCSPLSQGQCGTGQAWLRWCALANGASAGRTLRQLLERLRTHLVLFGVRELWALTLTSDWLHPYVADLGFRLSEHIITFARGNAALSEAQSPAQVSPLMLSLDLDALVEVDATAFNPPWQLGYADLRRLLRTATLGYVALVDYRIVGYVCALRERYDEAHIVRLAVAPNWQRRGIGRALLTAAMRALAERGVTYISLNTMASNTAAQRLYSQLGFVRERRRGFVWCLRLDEDR